MAFLIVQQIVHSHKDLPTQLKQAGMSDTAEGFVRKVLKGAGTFTLLFLIIAFFFFSKTPSKFLIILLLTPVWYMGFFLYFLQLPKVRAVKRAKFIDAEVSSMIRFFIIEINSSGSVYKSLSNVTEHFEYTGAIAKDILDKVNLGVPLKVALEETVETIPSEALRSVLWQIANHVHTGSDIVGSLHRTLEDITEQQKIEFKKYGKKLNALSLFYMIIAIILPTIGFTMLSAGLIFVGVNVNVWLILGIWLVFTFFQVLFIIISTQNRPVVEM